MRRYCAGLFAIMIALALSACSTTTSSPATGPEWLSGLLRFTPGSVAGDKLSGTWFRMVQPGGSAGAGPFMPNGDSAALGGTATLLEPGKSGGLRVGGYQSEPKPAFAEGHSLADSITKPTKFFAVEFGISTNPVDPQTGRPVAAPSVRNEGGKLSADLSAWAASWNNQEFNQGAPKPPPKSGAEVAGTKQVRQAWDWVLQKWFDQPNSDAAQGPPATGRYNARTRAFTLEWTSLIVGGPFNGFTGVWHLEGIFEPGDTTAPPAK